MTPKAKLNPHCSRCWVYNKMNAHCSKVSKRMTFPLAYEKRRQFNTKNLSPTYIVRA